MNKVFLIGRLTRDPELRYTSSNLANMRTSLAVDGRIQTGSYDGQDGKRVYTTDVIVENFQFLDTRGSRANTSDTGFNNESSSVTPYDFPTSETTNNSSDPFADFGAKIEVSDSELPF